MRNGVARRCTLVLLSVTLAGLVAVTMSSAPVSLSLGTWLATRSPYQDIFAKVIERFEEAHPGITVEHVQADVEEFKTRFAAGKSPELMTLRIANFGSDVKYFGLDLTPLIQRDRVKLDILKPGTAETGCIDGRYHALPFSPAVNAMYVNRSMFYEVGLDLPKKGWTLADLRNRSQKLTRRDSSDRVTTYGFRSGDSHNPSYFYPYLHGGKVLDPNTGDLAAMDESVIRALQWWVDFKWETGAYDTEGGYTERFTEGKVAMMNLWEGPRALFMDGKLHEQFDWAIVQLPRGEAPGFNSNLTQLIGISSQCKYVEEAWAFLKFFMSFPAQEVFAAYNYYPMTREGVRYMVDHLALPPGYTKETLFAPLLDPYDVSISHPFLLPGFNTVWATLCQAFQKSLLENVPVRLTLGTAEPAMKAAIAEARQR